MKNKFSGVSLAIIIALAVIVIILSALALKGATPAPTVTVTPEPVVVTETPEPVVKTEIPQACLDISTHADRLINASVKVNNIMADHFKNDQALFQDMSDAAIEKYFVQMGETNDSISSLLPEVEDARAKYDAAVAGCKA